MVLSNETLYRLPLMSLGVAWLGAPSTAHSAVFSQEHWELPGSRFASLSSPYHSLAYTCQAIKARIQTGQPERATGIYH